MVKIIDPWGSELVEDYEAMSVAQFSDKWFYGDRARTYRQADAQKWHHFFRALLSSGDQILPVPRWALDLL